MILSMTGLGAIENDSEGISYRIEARTFNNRYLDIRVRLPSNFLQLEEKIKKEIKKVIRRGRIELSVTIKNNSNEKKIQFNPIAIEQIREIAKEFELGTNRSLNFDLGTLIHFPDLFIHPEGSEFQELDTKILLDLTNQVLKDLYKMRKKEGEMLEKVLNTHISVCEKKIKEIELHKEDSFEKHKSRLLNILEKLDPSLDEKNPRIMQEIGMILEKCDISEEINRFHSHLKHYAFLIQQEYPIGKKLDFLSQELNREANTICSKSESSFITQLAIDLKSEIESFREQTQNIE